MTATRTFVIATAALLAGIAAMWALLTFQEAQADAAVDAGPGPGPAVSSLVEPTQPSILVPPDPTTDTGGFISWVTDGFKAARKSGALFSWGILVAFAILAAAWQRLKPKGDDKPS